MPTISTLLVRPLVAALEPVEGGPAAFFRATDLSPELLADRDAVVSPAQFCVAWSEAARLTGDATLGLTLAEAMPEGAFGLVEYLCRSTPTLGEGLRQWVRYLSILDDAVTVGLAVEGERASLRVLHESEAPAPGSHELCFALVAQRARAMVGEGFAVTSVGFTHRAADAGRYERFFGAPVRFGAPHTELCLEAALLDAPLRTADPNLLAVLVPSAEARLADVSTEPPLTQQVRRTLKAALSQGGGQLEDVAASLGFTGRSLQRRLKDDGTSFQDLREETRRALADRYLAEDLAIAEISFLLGFSAPSAFFRAFKRWTGVTPLEHRAALG